MGSQLEVKLEEPKKESLSAEGRVKEPKPIQLEDEDEFEEFPRCEARAQKNALELDSELNVWADNWDDENIEKDFHAMLREELSKSGQNPTNL
ncbi:unnamed protein product [Bursaphelenchus xylophilus]|uniref:26S proteasome complex subunit dss-1 n=1 Tax=Bursaphelenchus xylophilus TaxID=6326 RepID=A0A1I7RYA5_BURXY|nr:unnamed protein product [Bursaphelenchus xylophilus]CAG9085518.1 unnamed protein product [Bursaphelenchus xylophilus]